MMKIEGAARNLITEAGIKNRLAPLYWQWRSHMRMRQIVCYE